jgi:hypothetical protein
MEYQVILDWLKVNWFPIVFVFIVVLLMLRGRVMGWWRKRKYEEAKDKVFPELKHQEYNLIESTDSLFKNLDKAMKDIENPDKNIMLLTQMMQECQKKVNEVNVMIDNMVNMRKEILDRYKALGERMNRLRCVNNGQPAQQPQQPQQQTIIPETPNYNDTFLHQEDNKVF